MASDAGVEAMRSVLDALAAEQAALDALLDRCDDAGWRRASRCDGWDVADVVLHLAQTNELAIASAEGCFPEVAGHFARDARQAATTVDAAAELRVAQERGGLPADLLARWKRSGSDLLGALESGDPHARVTWVAGELSLHTLATTRLAETWIHHGDVAAAFGVVPAPHDGLRHIARLAWRTLPYAFTRDGDALTGPVAFRLTGPDGTPWTFAPDAPPRTTISGDALSLCLVAARRLAPAESQLVGEGPDAERVLALVRTYGVAVGAMGGAMSDNPARTFGFVAEPELARPVVVSPHLDDAVLSCGRFLAAHRGATVITVFAASPPEYTDPLNEWDTRCGFQPGDDTMGVRRAEDAAAMELLGAAPTWLGFHQQSHVARDDGGDAWPNGVLDALADAVDAARPTAVVQPLGLSHPDHVCCSQIALALREQVLARGDPPAWFAYEDHPYRVLPSVLAARLAAVARGGVVLTPARVPTDANDERAWRAFECYATQVEGLDSDWDLRGRRGQPEGYWRLDDPAAFAHLRES